MAQASIPPVTDGSISSADLRKFLNEKTRTILEIGAHHGRDTPRFLDAAQKATVYAFEPDPRAAARFRWRGHPRVRFFECAIGAEEGTATFHMSDGTPPGAQAGDPVLRKRYAQGWDQSGSLRPPKAHKRLVPWVLFERTITVPTRSLDSWRKEHGIGQVDFIWADVQGAEGDLIAGGRETLAATKYLYTEYSDMEVYEGQISLPQMLALLPTWSVVTRYACDVLLRNDSLLAG